MTYMNQVIKRTCPMTPAQCAVMAVLSNHWATVSDIWKRGPTFCRSSYFTSQQVSYGTVCSVLQALHQQGFCEKKRVARRKVQYRRLKRI